METMACMYQEQSGKNQACWMAGSLFAEFPIWPGLSPASYVRVDNCTQVTLLSFVAWKGGQRVESGGKDRKGMPRPRGVCPVESLCCLMTVL